MTDAREAMERALEVLNARCVGQFALHVCSLCDWLATSPASETIHEPDCPISLLTAALAALDKERALTELVEIGQEIDAAARRGEGVKGWGLKIRGRVQPFAYSSENRAKLEADVAETVVPVLIYEAREERGDGN